MARRERRWYWLTRRDRFDGIDAAHAFDVIRYDGARLEPNPPDGFYLFSSDGDTAGPNVDRLASYHVTPAQVFPPMEADTARYKVGEWFDDYLKRQPKELGGRRTPTTTRTNT